MEARKSYKSLHSRLGRDVFLKEIKNANGPQIQSSSRSTATSMSCLQDRHSKVCRSMYGRSGSIQTSRIVAPHIGHPGRSDAAGTEVVGNASIDFFTLDNPLSATHTGFCDPIIIKNGIATWR
jgi:hypothetical protein